MHNLHFVSPIVFRSSVSKWFGKASCKSRIVNQFNERLAMLDLYNGIVPMTPSSMTIRPYTHEENSNLDKTICLNVKNLNLDSGVKNREDAHSSLLTA